MLLRTRFPFTRGLLRAALHVTFTFVALTLVTLIPRFTGYYVCHVYTPERAHVTFPLITPRCCALRWLLTRLICVPFTTLRVVYVYIYVVVVTLILRCVTRTDSHCVTVCPVWFGAVELPFGTPRAATPHVTFPVATVLPLRYRCCAAFTVTLTVCLRVHPVTVYIAVWLFGRSRWTFTRLRARCYVC